MQEALPTSGPSPASAADLDLVRRLVLAHGWNTTCFQLLNPGLRYWFSSARDAVAGYVEQGRWWVVAGAPVAAERRWREAVAELEAAAHERAKRIAYFAAEQRLEGLPAPPGRRARLRLGAQPIFDPRQWPATLARRTSLRAQLARARNKGVRVREWRVADAAGDPRLRRCLDEWLARRGLPPLLFLTTPWTLGRLADRRVFVAERDGVPLGFLVSSPIPARRWALVEQVVRGAAAPNGTAELLVGAAFDALAGECDRVTLGLAPLADRAGGWEQAPPWLRLLVGWARVHGRRFYNFRGLEAFKAKLDPVDWEPVWLLADAPRIGPGALWAVLGAFAGGRPVRFAARALARAVSQELLRLRGR
ncbi:MAG TPA: phosphatidylglycerol lysyltransferase domain-containing protein [Thermoanaerobaculia bacterium]|nr:phosphatidylglycerol lysyltransferase domain-containing protein [Thermoanaerobaculia bacterium]